MTDRFCPRCEKMVPFGLHPCTPPRKAEALTAPKAPAVKSDVATPTPLPHALLT
jgi:hypothetical protein